MQGPRKIGGAPEARVWCGVHSYQNCHWAFVLQRMCQNKSLKTQGASVKLKVVPGDARGIMWWQVPP